MPRPELSLVIPIYNEEEVLPQLDERLKELLGKLGGLTTEVVFVNDGSKDRSMDILRRLAAREARYKVLGFSRNFGHQRAITAGMDKSRGRAVVVMDADLQDPPEVILEMVERWKQGYDVVYGRRRSREGESWFKLFTAKWFYRVFAALIPIEVPLDAGDFRLMSRRVVRTLAALRENHRFVRGLVAWVGFKQTAVEYDRARRAAGETKYPLKKMLAFAVDGIASFSIQPLRFATYVGVFVGAASVLYAIASIITYVAGMNVPGWTTQVVLTTFLFSVQFFMLGVLGEYVGRIYEQSKRRPLYVLSERINFGSRRRAEKLVTNDLEEVVRSPSFPPPSARTPSVPPALPQRTSKPPAAAARPTSEVPPPPAAVVAAGAAAEASISSHMPARKSVTPAPPSAGSNKPPPLKLSSSVSSMPAAPPAPAPGPAGRPRLPSFASVAPSPPRNAGSVAPEPRTAPSAPPPAARPTPSAPPVAVRHTPSAPPVAAPRTPSAPPVARTPSVPPVARKPSSPPSARTPSAPPVVRPSASAMRAAAGAPPASVSPSGPPKAPSVPAMRAVKAPSSEATPETARSPSAMPGAPKADDPSDA